MKLILQTLFLSLSFLLACAGPDAPVGDELSEESADDGEALSKADGAFENFSFFQVRQDYRKCMYPMCGGYWISRPNRHFSPCADGSWQEECYVVGVDWSSYGLSPEESDALLLNKDKLLVKGSIEPMELEHHTGFGQLVISEAWLGGSDSEPLGTLTRVRDTGIRCFTHPCPNTLFEGKLNSVLGAAIDEIYLEDTGVGSEEIEGAYAQAYGEDGLIVAGYRYWVWDGSWLKGRYVTQFYERFRSPDPTDNP